MMIPDVPYFQQMKEYTCAPACLRMALAFRFPDKPVPEEAELEDACHSDQITGSDAEDVVRAARKYGLTLKSLRAARLEAELETAIREGCPAIANMPLRTLPYHGSPSRKDWHSVLIVGMDDRYVYLHDPDDPLYWGQPRRFENRADSYVDRKVQRADFLGKWSGSLNPWDENAKYLALRI